MGKWRSASLPDPKAPLTVVRGEHTRVIFVGLVSTPNTEDHKALGLDLKHTEPHKTEERGTEQMRKIKLQDEMPNPIYRHIL